MYASGNYDEKSNLDKSVSNYFIFRFFSCYVFFGYNRLKLMNADRS